MRIFYGLWLAFVVSLLIVAFAAKNDYLGWFAILFGALVPVIHFTVELGGALWLYLRDLISGEPQEPGKNYSIHRKGQGVATNHGPNVSIDSAIERIRFPNSVDTETVTSSRIDSHPKPGRLLHPTPENFEEYCAEWCRYLGYQDAVKTQNSRDGGIDIRASNMIAQVKFQANPVGVGPIRELNGVKRDNQETLFYALNGYTPEARREASEIGMTLITVRPVEGTIDLTA